MPTEPEYALKYVLLCIIKIYIEIGFVVCRVHQFLSEGWKLWVQFYVRYADRVVYSIKYEACCSDLCANCFKREL